MKHLGAVITPEVETGEREKNIGAADIREEDSRQTIPSLLPRRVL